MSRRHDTPIRVRTDIPDGPPTAFIWGDVEHHVDRIIGRWTEPPLHLPTDAAAPTVATWRGTAHTATGPTDVTYELAVTDGRWRLVRSWTR